MSIRSFRSRYRVLSQAAAIALVAGMGAACSGDVTRFSQPVFKNPFKRTARVEQPSPPSDVGYADNSYNRSSYGRPLSGSSVARSDLPPPSDYGAVSRNYDPPPRYEAPVDRYEPNRDYASAPEAPRSGAGVTVRVGAGETLSSISRRYNVPMSTIARANGIDDPSRVQAGQRIYIPGASEDTGRYDVANLDSRNYGANSASRQGRTAPGPSVLGTIPASPDDRYSADATVGDRHVVGPGESLGSIASQYGVSRADLMAANGIKNPNIVREGQRLVIPGTGRSDRMVASLDGAPRVARAEVDSDAYGPDFGTWDTPPRTTRSVPRNTDDSVDGPAGYTPPAVRDDVASIDPGDKGSADGQQFRWPVRGRIISGFGSKPNGERNDGINLSVPAGTAVKAAEAGTVIYAGNEIAGYGNLVLVRHSGGWVTAYAHTSDMLVRRGDTVRRGQTIAHAGATGSVNAPQLHFELRRGSNPVNPMDYLAGA